jgi:hypothetical protein
MVACGTSGLLGGRFVVLPVEDNSLMPVVPVFAFAVVFLAVGFFAVAFFATVFLGVVFLIAIFFLSSL